VYNCRVAEYHTYFTGQSTHDAWAVWAHNAYLGVKSRGGHHGIPKFLGGDRLQDLVRGGAGWDRHHSLFHRLLDRRLQRAGFPTMNRGKKAYDAYFRQHPGSQVEAFGIVNDLAKSFDRKFKTDFLDAFYQNFSHGRFERMAW
ncbi:MAG TPA: hypothetical protein PKD86_15760, partial [Gemmatales bacterium]|nr:hypothetical protein [Gemmatales bacterium]